jgi:uncharacterized protein YyaL (SSP411 family)
MVDVARSSGAIGRALAVVGSEAVYQQLASEVPFAAQAAKPHDTARAWVCINRSCRDPVASAAALRAVLDTAVVNRTRSSI